MKQKIKLQTKFVSKNPLMRIANQAFLQSIADLVILAGANQILDCGCGEGIVLERLCQIKPRLNLHGFDLDKSSTKIAKKIVPRAKIKTASIYQIPYPDNFVDLAICTEVLEHLERPEKALAEVRRITKKYAIVSVPHEPFFRLANLARGAYIKSFGNTPGHINNWLPYGFKQMLARDFIIREEKYPFIWMMFFLEKK